MDTPLVVVPETTSFKTSDLNTDFEMWLVEAQEFTNKHLGVKVNLRKMFVIPEEIPWASAIPIFDPGGLTNRQALDKVGMLLGPNKPYEEVNVMQYSDSKAGNLPTLHLIENLVKPNNDTMGMSPNNLVATRKNWLGLRGYILAFALNNFVTNGYLDPQTWTWFPNDRLSSGKVARGNWYPGDAQVRFFWNGSKHEHSSIGARLAISLPLKP